MLARRVWRDRSLDAAGMVAKATSAAEFKMRVAGDGELQSSEFYRVRYSGALRQLQDAVFSEVYDDYFGQSSWITTADYDRFFSMLEVARASNVLDVASGWGAPALRLARRTGCSVVGIEINHEAVARRRQAFRLAKAYGQHGPQALVSRRRGRPSNRCYPTALHAEVIGIIKERGRR